MSDAEVIKPSAAGTKEEVDYVASVNIHSVRNKFENPEEENATAVAEEESGDLVLRDPEVVRSTAAGTREEVAFEASIDLKSARSRFEHKPEIYVPRNRIKEREEEVKRQRDAVAAAMSPKDGEPGDDVVRTVDVDSKEFPDYQVDLKATKQMFEGGKAPAPVKKETRTRQHVEVKGDIVRPEPAGTKMVAELPATTDIKSVKMRFENPSNEESEVSAGRKSPIDMQEEARRVMQKEMENKEETKKPCVVGEGSPRDVANEPEKIDVESNAVLDSIEGPRDAVSHRDDDEIASVSSEELVEKGEEEYEGEETEEVGGSEIQQSGGMQEEKEENKEQEKQEAAEYSVNVGQDETEKNEEPESVQGGESYENVEDRSTEVRYSTELTVVLKDEQRASDDGVKQNGYNDDEQNGYSELGNHHQNENDAAPNDNPKGITIDLDNPQQQFSLHSSSPTQAEDASAEGNNGDFQ